VKNTWHQYYRVGMIKVFIVNYESLKKYFVESIDKGDDEALRLNHIRFKENINVFKAVIGDELHRCKDGKTQQTKFMMGISRGKDYILGLTGTPVVNKPKDLVSQLHIINRLGDLGGYKYFMNRYCGGNGTGAFNLEELNYKLSTNCFFRRQKKEVLQELPDKMRQIVLCDISTRKEYKEALNDLGEYLTKWKNKTDAEVEKSLRGEIMVRIGICKNISARGKMNEVIDHIDDVIESGHKIVVFIHQKEIAAALKKHYPKAVSITGDDGMDARQYAVDSFQKDAKTNIIICSIKAAGVGITLTSSSRVAFVELPWHAADCDQCEDRCHRIGQKDSVQATYFLGKNTIDEDIYKIIESKRKIANIITGSADNVQREIIDRIAESLFNTKDEAEEDNEVAMKEMLQKTF
jgi:SWI/SNF-related matrix-associated actin-dependent regulator 1 of chromatin subfamily A